MALYVQLYDADVEAELHHKVASFENVSVDHLDPMGSRRAYKTECGLEVEAPTHRMAEAEGEPGGDRCPACFKKGS